MLQLRTSLPLQEYLPTARRMMQSNGYCMAALYEKDDLRAEAGYRFMEMLYSGKALMDWLKGEARANGCLQLHLDSGVQREQAPAFTFERA